MGHFNRTRFERDLALGLPPKEVEKSAILTQRALGSTGQSIDERAELLILDILATIERDNRNQEEFPHRRQSPSPHRP